MTSVKGCCPLDCQDTCCWVAQVEDGRVVRVDGAAGHPITRGTLCAKVNDYQARTYAPDRLLYPLRRIGPKGEGRFERIPWEEAISTISTRFQQIAAEDGPEALLPHSYLGSMGVVQRRALMRIFHFLGASQPYGSICGASGNALESEGHPRGFDPEDLRHSRLVLLWGINILTTCHHQWPFLEEARRHGARLICIDPRRTRTAAKCDLHLPVRPGTDRFLAAGIARLLFEEGLADLEFARDAAVDLDEYRLEVAGWTPERVANVCGIGADDVIALAREFGTARPAVIRAGVAPQQIRQGEAFVRSISALAILGGHWRHKGGGLFIESNPVLYETRAARPDLVSGKPRRLDLAKLANALTDPKLTPPIRGLMIWGTNPAVVLPDTGRVRQGLARENLFTVVIEHFLTDTARFADIVLPATTQLEHFDVVGAWGHHYISANNPAVDPCGEAKSHGEIMRLLARRMGLNHPALQETDEEIAASALPDDVDLSTLKAAGWYKTRPAAPAFRSPEGGKLRLGGNDLSGETAPQPGLLQLLTPKSHYFLNSSFANMPRQRRTMQRPTVEMNPDDATDRKLLDGQFVRLHNPQGELHVWVQITGGIRRGVISLCGKWWNYPEETSAVANLLTPSAWSPEGQPAYNETYVAVAAAASDSMVASTPAHRNLV